MKNILLLDCIINQAQNLKIELNKSGYNVMVVNSSVLAKPIDISKFDLVLITEELNKANNFDLIQYWKEKEKKTPVITLDSKAIYKSNKTSESKDNNYTALKKEINQILTLQVEHNIFTNFVYDLEKNIFYENQSIVKLTKSELAIIKYLYLNSKRVVSKDELIKNIYQNQITPQSNVIERHIKSIRFKMNTNPITTKRTIGYQLKIK